MPRPRWSAEEQESTESKKKTEVRISLSLNKHITRFNLVFSYENDDTSERENTKERVSVYVKCKTTL
jgi:hypothetical protein